MSPLSFGVREGFERICYVDLPPLRHRQVLASRGRRTYFDVSRCCRLLISYVPHRGWIDVVVKFSGMCHPPATPLGEVRRGKHSKFVYFREVRLLSDGNAPLHNALDLFGLPEMMSQDAAALFGLWVRSMLEPQFYQ